MDAYAASFATEPPEGFAAPVPLGCVPYPYQHAGVWYAKHFTRVLLGDEMGVGKTWQALMLCNLLRSRRVLIVCPAGLRLNWQVEAEKLLVDAPVMRINPVLNGKSDLAGDVVIVSYDLAVRRLDELLAQAWDVLICDEAHYVKSPAARRSKAILGTRKNPGLMHRAERAVFLTGTPAPNRPHEFWNLLYKAGVCQLGYDKFLARYCVVNPYTQQVVGAKNTDELGRKLRERFMVRREKKDVLKDLPPKRYKMVVFPKTGETAKILEKEKAFDAGEIIAHGQPVGTSLPEVRKEMGLAKLPQALAYIEDLLEEVDKVVVFAHHRDVLFGLHRGLAEHGSVLTFGGTWMAARQQNVNLFQADPNCHVFIGQLVAAGTGITLTAASHVVFVEASWVPGENEQASDRCHRIGQKDSVLVHYLVVEGSLDAKILGAAAAKAADLKHIMQGE